MTYDNPIKPVHYSVKHETVRKWNFKKGDFHLILIDSGIDQFSVRINEKGENIIFKQLHSVF